MVREIKTQTFGINQRTGLLHMLAEHLTQHRMQQMRCRMIAPDGVATRAFHLKMRGGAACYGALNHFADMHE